MRGGVLVSSTHLSVQRRKGDLETSKLPRRAISGSSGFNCETLSQRIRQGVAKKVSEYSVIVLKEMVSKGIGTIRRCGIDGVIVVLLNKVCHFRSRV